MGKSFYRIRNPKKVYFVPDMRIRSYAYGQQVHDEAVSWVEAFTREWNRPRHNFLLLESGSPGNIPARFDGGELIFPRNAADAKKPIAADSVLCPLWLEDLRLEMGKNGTLRVNDRDTGFSLGVELKAWGCDVLWSSGKKPEYYLFVIGRQDDGNGFSLSAYGIERGREFSLRLITRVPLPPSLHEKSHLYCFGNHIFLIHNARLNYYHFRPEEHVLDEVAIESDMPNEDKDCCRQVSSPVVLDSGGSVYWQAGNNVHSFPIGYPRRITTICGGSQYTIDSIQCFQETLFVYRYNRQSGESSCAAYEEENGLLRERTFNRNTVKNVIYHEKGGTLFYIKIPSGASKAYLATYRDQTETIRSEFALDGETKLFCANGSVYVGCNYVGS